MELADGIRVFGRQPLDEEAGRAITVHPVAARFAGTHIEIAGLGTDGIRQAFDTGPEGPVGRVGTDPFRLELIGVHQFVVQNATCFEVELIKRFVGRLLDMLCTVDNRGMGRIAALG